MGREARANAVIRKWRTCKACQKLTFVTRDELIDHAKMCKRAGDVGLVLPGEIIVQTPNFSMRRLED